MEPIESTLTIEIIRVLHNHGHLAYLVGGCVRDRILGNVPQDFDISTDATPAELLTYFPMARQVGAHFGVIRVPGPGGTYVEVATFRSDHGYEDGRRPTQVHFERDPRQDVLRRDFTINALLEDIVTGEVIDYVGGRADLAAGVVRAIGDPTLRFREDHLRLLRAIRFAARFGFHVEAGTFAAMRKAAPSISTIAAERVREELTRILTEGGASQGLKLLSDSELLVHVLPEVQAFQGVAQPVEYHPEGDVWTHVLLMLKNMVRLSATLAWGVLLHDVGKPATFRVADRIRFDGHVEVGVIMARNLLMRMKFSQRDTDQILALIANHMRFKDVFAMRESTLKRFLRLPGFEEHLELHRLDCLASHGKLDSYEFVERKLSELTPEQLRPARLLTGNDLIAAGFRPGPGFSKALEAVETAQLEGTVATTEQALELAVDVLSR